MSNKYKGITNYRKSDLEKMQEKIKDMFEKCEIRG